MHQLPDAPSNPGEFLPSPAVHREKGALAASYTDAGYVNPPDASSEPETGGLIEYWRILRRRRGTLFFIAAVGAVLGFVVTLPQTPVYQARTSVEIVGLNNNFLNIKESDPLNENNASVDPVDIQTQIKILQSDSLVDAVLGKLKKGQTVTPTAPSASGWRKLLNLPGAEAIDSREKSANYAAHHYKVKALGPTRIIEVTVDSMNPQLATDFANMLTSEYIDQNLESRSHMSQHTSEFLARQLDDMRIRLEHSEDNLQATRGRRVCSLRETRKTTFRKRSCCNCSRLYRRRRAIGSRSSRAGRWRIRARQRLSRTS